MGETWRNELPRHTFIRRGQAYPQLGPKQAIQTYNKLMSEDVENQSKWKAESAAAYREFNKYNEAIALYQQLVQEDAANADRWLWETATPHKDAGQWKEAIETGRRKEATERLRETPKKSHSEMHVCIHRRQCAPFQPSFLSTH